MVLIDYVQINVDNELEVSRNVNEIIRYTNDNIVNETHELKAKSTLGIISFPTAGTVLRKLRDM